MAIEYNYPVEQLDELIRLLAEGITPVMTAELKEEVALRYQELQHEGFDDDEDDDDFRTAKEKHEHAMKAMEEQKRRSHSRDIIELELTDEEKAKLEDDMSESYIRSDPNSIYNISDEDLSDDEQRRTIMRRLQSLGKAYYHAEDFRNAIFTIQEAINYSLAHDYPWLSFEHACDAFNRGRIHYAFSALPALFSDYSTQITNPEHLSGIVKGDISMFTQSDVKPKKKKRKKDEEGVKVPYTIIGKSEHEMYVKQHQLGYNTPISVILKSCSTIYNRYVMPTSFSFGGTTPTKELPRVDWTQPGAGKRFFELRYGKQANPVGDLVSYLNEVNGPGVLSHTIGNGIKWFLNGFRPHFETTRTISTSLQQDEKVLAIEQNILNQIRASNPNL